MNKNILSVIWATIASMSVLAGGVAAMTAVPAAAKPMAAQWL
jgi:hypothetical protein